MILTETRISVRAAVVLAKLDLKNYPGCILYPNLPLFPNCHTYEDHILEVLKLATTDYMLAEGATLSVTTE